MKPYDGFRSVSAAAQQAGVNAFRRLAAVGRRSPLARELTLALLFKMVVLSGLWALFFRPHPDAREPPRPAILPGSIPFSSPNQEALKP
jgi:hypothetical protein